MLATKQEASLKSRLDFYKVPAWMKQWPFAHTVDMTYRLKDGVLEVLTEVTNLANEPMPLVIGYHPHFNLTDSKRDEWTASIAAKKHYLLPPQKLPTGETEPIETFASDPQAVSVKDHDLDDVSATCPRRAGARHVHGEGKAQKLDVIFGPNYRSPSSGPRAAGGQERNFICFEPMVGVTNAVNMAHKGTYSELQSIAPGATWRESWWVKPSGFEAAPASDDESREDGDGRCGGRGQRLPRVAAIELVAHAVYAPSVMPDVSTPEAMAAYVDSMPLGAFLFVLAAYVAGTVVGGFVGIAIARRTPCASPASPAA